MNLVLFFTSGVSLQTWSQNGSMTREIALYKKLQEQGIKVSFVTYGNANDLKYKDELEGIRILCNYLNLPPKRYVQLIPILHFSSLLQADIIKTNQMKGADVALRNAKVFRKKFVARCGYLWSDFSSHANKRHADTQDGFLKAQSVESVVFSSANQIILTTTTMKEYVIKNYGINENKINVIPNYVLTDIFSPKVESFNLNTGKKRVFSVGRLSEVKNYSSLIKACEGLPVELAILGEGELQDALIAEAKDRGVDLKIYKNIPNHEIPDLMSTATIFALVSHYEGHPKALLEAMSCGIAVLGSDPPGIKAEIVHGVNGWLCKPDSESIRAGILHLLSNPQLRQELGKNARETIVNKYSLEIIAAKEYLVLQNLMRK